MSSYKVYSQIADEDLELFKELDLNNFSVDHQNEIFVGEYKLKDYEKAIIKIYVTCMPVHF